MELAGCVVAVAGGSGALGRAVVSSLQVRGAIPVVLDREPLTKTVEGVRLYPVDAQDAVAVDSAFSKIEDDVGPIDALVNAIGIIDSAPLVNLLAPQGQRILSAARFDATVEANLRPIFIVGAAAAERLLRNRRPGVIVNIGSVSALGNAGQSAYAAAKAGVHALTQTWARELGGLGIRVVTVAPGFIDTESMRAKVPEHVIDRVISETQLRRLGRPAEVAHAVLFAIENDFLTATRIDVDGGLVP